MLRKILFTVTAILFSSSFAFATQYHNDIEILLTNVVERVSPGFEYGGGRPVVVTYRERDYDIGSGNIALQLGTALLAQHASAWARNGTSAAYQIGSIIGNQDQIVGDWTQYVGLPDTLQDGDLNMNLTGVLYTDDGWNSARGIQRGFTNQRQMAISSDGSRSNQSLTVHPMQYARLHGRGSGSVVVQTDVNVHTGQSQSQ